MTANHWEPQIIPSLLELEPIECNPNSTDKFERMICHEFTEEEGEQIERIIAAGPPQWVKDLL